jgi:hypothetical protein
LACVTASRTASVTHLLEQKVDIRVIQVLLGHKKLDTTARDACIASTTLRAVKSPLEYLSPLPHSATQRDRTLWVAGWGSGLVPTERKMF